MSSEEQQEVDEMEAMEADKAKQVAENKLGAPIIGLRVRKYFPDNVMLVDNEEELQDKDEDDGEALLARRGRAVGARDAGRAHAGLPPGDRRQVPSAAAQRPPGDRADGGGERDGDEHVEEAAAGDEHPLPGHRGAGGRSRS